MVSRDERLSITRFFRVITPGSHTFKGARRGLLAEVAYSPACSRNDLNVRPSACRADALPLSYENVVRADELALTLWRDSDSNRDLQDYEPCVFPLHHPAPRRSHAELGSSLAYVPLPTA